MRTVQVETSYDDVAAEYYDRTRHPTCDNFRDASRILAISFLELHGKDAQAEFCDIGAGRSLLAELIPQTGRLDHLCLIDKSGFMLEYSTDWKWRGARVIVGDATKSIPLNSASIDVALASLGDPYNISGFWRELHRILRPGGYALFTTPSFEWASAFRGQAAAAIAEFELADGRALSLPSYVYEPSVQVGLISESGLLVDSVIQVAVSALKTPHLSPKLALLLDTNGSVVTGFVCRRPLTG